MITFLQLSKNKMICNNLQQGSNESFFEIITRRRNSTQEEVLDFLELSKLVEDLGYDQILRHNSIKFRDFVTKDVVSVKVDGPSQSYSASAEAEERQHVSLSSTNKNNKVRSPSTFPSILSGGHVDMQCCYCFHKQKALEQKYGNLMQISSNRNLTIYK